MHRFHGSVEYIISYLMLEMLKLFTPGPKRYFSFSKKMLFLFFSQIQSLTYSVPN